MEIIELADQNFSALINTYPAVLVYFTADWCTACRSSGMFLSRIAERHEDTALTVVKVDADKFPDLLKLHEVSSLPNFQLYRHGGRVFQKAGTLSVAVFNKILRLAAQ